MTTAWSVKAVRQLRILLHLKGASMMTEADGYEVISINPAPPLDWKHQTKENDENEVWQSGQAERKFENEMRPLACS